MTVTPGDGMSFEELLANPHLQFDLRDELLPHQLAFGPAGPAPARPWLFEGAVNTTVAAQPPDDREATAEPEASVHKPFTDEGVTYCGWDGHDGCGQVWPCSTVQARRKGTAWDLLGADPSAEIQSGRASEVAAAEARGDERGYRRAIDALQDGERIAKWLGLKATGEKSQRSAISYLRHAVEYLEAVEGDDRADTQ